MNLEQLNISYINDNFKDWFNWEKVKPVKVKMTEKVLERAMNDKEISDELKPAPITLAQLFGSLKNLDKNSWYLTYIKDKNNTLRAVHVGRRGDGWHVDACSVSIPHRWGAGCRVFSCNFGTQTLEPSDFITRKEFEEFKAKIEKVIKI